ncbi:hypothetical protein P879_01729 [Paragonimus westermani]|uniref:LITAF domain-containing protein n=1 Tax=Paragonimus westermani TaxID=34504 RepID=A0A8T0DT19_9TREM|nr:hypothetical protein P879_01729 [Paragonimus westermani]
MNFDSHQIASPPPYTLNPSPAQAPKVNKFRGTHLSPPFTPEPIVFQVSNINSPCPFMQKTVYGEQPTTAFCSKCYRNVTTNVQFSAGFVTWISCLIIFLCGGILGCCFIPFFLKRCKDVRHFCPHCGIQLGVYQRKCNVCGNSDTDT